MQHNLDGRKSLNSGFRSLLSSASSQSSLRYTRVNQDGTIASESILCIHKSEANIFCWTDEISRIALLELLKGIYPLCSNPFGKWFGIWFWVPKHRTSQDIIKLIGCRFATLCFGWKKTVEAAKHGTGESNSTSTMCCHVLLKISAETTGPWDETAYLLLNGSPMAGQWETHQTMKQNSSPQLRSEWYPCIVEYIRGGAEWYNFLQFLAQIIDIKSDTHHICN